MRAWKGAGGGGPHPGLLRHLSRDDLVLHHYGEVRTAPTERHLAECPTCRERLRALRRDLQEPSNHAALSPPRPPIWRRILLALGSALDADPKVPR